MTKPSVEQRVRSAARDLVVLFRTRPALFDVALGLVMFCLAIYSSRIVLAQLVESERVSDDVRRNAEAAVRLGGANRESGQKILDLLAQSSALPSPAVTYALAAASSLPLIFRRRFAGTVHLVVLFAFVASLWFVPVNAAVPVTTVWATSYTFAAYARWSSRIRNTVLPVTVAIVLPLVSGFVRNTNVDKAEIPLRDKIAGLLSYVVLYGSSIALGLLMRRFRSTVETLESQKVQLLAQQDELARNASLAERVRIARELHDVLAHHVSVIGLHAGAARMALREDDSSVSASLQTIEAASRDVVTDLYRSLNVLRGSTDSGGATDAPTPNATQLEALFEHHEAAGFSLTRRIAADVSLFPSTVSLTVFRIVQEALTNVRKHGESSDSTVVDLELNGDTITLRIENIPALPRQTPNGTAILGAASGHGVRGMKERALLHGGNLTAQLRSDGGFSVITQLGMHA